MSSVALSRRDRPGDDQLRGRVCRHARPRAAVGRHPQFRGAATGRAGRRPRRGRCCRRSCICRAITSCPRARRGCPGTRGPTGSSASLPAPRGRRSPPGWSAVPRAGSVMPGSTARPTSCPGEARPRSRKSRRSRRRPLTCGTSATPGTTRFAKDDGSNRLENQEVVLTVPASFDEAARELTIEAAKRAELATITLLEEPQAAFYCWIVSHQDRWQREVRAGELILVCDIGGGTTDFSLITVVETPTGPGFPPRRRRRSPDAGRRQHRPGAGPSRREEAGRRAARLRAVECPAVRLPDGQGKAAGRAAAGTRALAGHDRRPGLEADRRQHPVRADASRGRGDRARRVLPARSPRRGSRSAEPRSACRSSGCRSSPIRPFPST